jgi:protein-disulfide isomerase
MSRTHRIAVNLLLASSLFVASGQTCNLNIFGPPNPPGGTNPPPDLDELLMVLADDHVEGDANAPVTVIEFADFQCPFCGRFSRDTLPTIRTEYIETGKVRWVFRHMPLRRIHECAETAARASECAHDQGMFDEFHDRLFQTQSTQNPPCNAAVKQHAAVLGLDADAFAACLDGGGKAARVQRDVDNGTALGITATPAFFINGRLVLGALSVAEMSAELDAALQ